MATPGSKAVDTYIAAQPPAVRRALKRVRSTIRKALPNAEEVISYKIPAYRLPGGLVVFFAGWAEHYSLYPGSGRIVAQFKDELKNYEISKGTIRFPIVRPVPVKLIERIAKFRAREINARAKARASARKKK